MAFNTELMFQLRRRFKLKYTRLSELSGLHRDTLMKLENKAITDPRTSTLKALEKGFKAAGADEVQWSDFEIEDDNAPASPPKAEAQTA